MAKDSEIRRRVLRGVASNYLERAIWLGSFVFLTPFIVHHLGATAFGLWTLVSSVVSYSSLMDFGIQGAVTKCTAEYMARGEVAQEQKLVATSLCLYSGLGLLAISLSVALLPVFPSLFHIPIREQAEARWLIVLMGAGFGLFMPATTFLAVLQGLQRFDITNVIGSIWAVASAILTVIVLLLGGGVLGMVAINIPLELAMQGLLIWRLRQVAPWLRIGWRDADLSLARHIISLSASFFVLQSATQLRTRTDPIIIGARLSLAAITPYTIARKLADVPTSFSQQAVDALLPLSSAMQAENDSGRLQAIFLTGTRLSLAMCLPIVLTLVILGQPILTIWVGVHYAGNASLLPIMACSTLVSLGQASALSILQGMARHRPVAVMLLGAAIAGIVLSIVLAGPFGVSGIALGSMIPNAIVFLGLVLPYTVHVLGISGRETFDQILWPILKPLPATLLALIALRAVLRPTLLIPLGIVACLGLLIYALGYLAMSANDTERYLYRKAARGARDALAASRRRV